MRIDEHRERDTTSTIDHDTFDEEGYWAPPGGAELYFHSGFSEPVEGLESDGLHVINPFALDAMKSLEELDENLRLKGQEFSTEHRKVADLLAKQVTQLLDQLDAKAAMGPTDPRLL